ncbi:MAG: hypothetical protein WBK91_05015 [Alphaproteobacteria bacterium]
MTRRITLLSALALLVCQGADAAEPQKWKTQNDCETATRRECVIDSAKTWMPIAEKSVKKPTVKPQAAVPAPKIKAMPAAATPATKEMDAPTQSKTSEEGAQPQTAGQPKAAEIAPPPVPVQESSQESAKEGGGFFAKIFGGKNQAKTPDAARPSRPERARPATDPEQLLRGKVWTSEGECKKEALKGTCSSVNCATHTGGVCSGFTSMIWIYR